MDVKAGADAVASRDDLVRFLADLAAEVQAGRHPADNECQRFRSASSEENRRQDSSALKLGHLPSHYARARLRGSSQFSAGRVFPKAPRELTTLSMSACDSRQMRRVIAMVLLGLFLSNAAGASGAQVVPASVKRAITRAVPRAFAFVPTSAPSGWRYFSWDAGTETPALFKRGRGLNIWFSTAGSGAAGPGFHVFRDPLCSMRGAMRTFRINGIVVAWSTTFEDSQAWRCVGARHQTRMLVSADGTGYDSTAVAAHRASAMARMVASVRPAE
jgi:hypothetical protein